MKVWLYLACCLLVVERIYTQNEPPKLIATAPGANDDVGDPQEDDPKRLVCYLNFETTGRGIEESGVIRVIQDKSGYDNNGELSEGGEILQQPETAKDFTCNQYARLYSSEISFNGNLFQAKPRKAITIAAWIKLEDFKDPHSIFDTVGRSHGMGQYHFEVHNGVLRWFHRNECQQTVFETMAHEVPKGKWVHVAGTYNSKNTQAKAYVDGILRNQSIGAGELSRDWDTKVRIGMASCGADPCRRPLKGSIDEFRIYNYALTPDEIHALVGACKNDDGAKPARSDVADSKKGRLYADDDDAADGSDDEPKRLVVYYNFEKMVKPKLITDKSGYENSGILASGGEILKFSDKDYTCSQGARLWDSGINFKGDTFQAKPRLAITVAAWVRLEKRQGQHSIFDTVGTTHAQGQYHFEVNNGIVRWFHRDEAQKTVFETMAHTVDKGKWVHIAGTYDSKTGQAKIFINGEIRNQSIGTGMLSRDWGIHAGISNVAKNRPLQGSVDEFRIYNYALTPDEIRALVSACKSPEAAEKIPKVDVVKSDTPSTPSSNESESEDPKKKKKRSVSDWMIRKLNFT